MNSSLEGGFVYPTMEVAHVGVGIDSSITIFPEVLHLLKDLLVADNLHLKIVGLEFPLALEGAKLLFGLPKAALGKTWTKKNIMKFLE